MKKQITTVYKVSEEEIIAAVLSKLGITPSSPNGLEVNVCYANGDTIPKKTAIHISITKEVEA